MTTVFKKHHARAAAAAVLTVGMAITSALAAQHSGGQPGASSGASSGGAMHGSMMPGMQKMMEMKPTGDTDRDFASMMKMHHQMAIDMAQAEIKDGKSPELKALARKMIKDSKRDIGEIDKWLAAKK